MVRIEQKRDRWLVVVLDIDSRSRALDTGFYLSLGVVNVLSQPGNATKQCFPVRAADIASTRVANRHAAVARARGRAR